MTFINSSVIVVDNVGSTVFFDTNQDGPLTINIPAGATGTYTWVVSRAGFTCQTGIFDATGGGARTGAPVPLVRLQPDGRTMFTNQPLPAVNIDFDLSGVEPRAFIDIPDQSVTAQQVLDTVEIALETQPGLEFLARTDCSEITLAELSAGNFLFMGTGYRFRRAAPGDVNATVGAFPISADGVPLDGSNGSVTFLSSSLPEDVAQAVWDYLESNPTIAGSMKDALQKTRDHAKAIDLRTQTI